MADLARRERPDVGRGARAARTVFSGLTFLAAMALWMGCPPLEDGAAGTAAADGDGYLIDAVRYVAAWDLSGVTVQTDGGFSVTNDEGVSFRITGGVVTSYQASLTPCEVSTGGVFSSPRAYAGHGDQVDVSTIAEPVGERLDVLAETALGTVAFTATDYCGVHWLAASWDGVGSLELTGTWQGPDGIGGTLDLATTVANGLLVDLADTFTTDAAAASGAVEVRFVRDLGALFEGISAGDIADETFMERTLMTNLIAATDVVTAWTSP